MFRNLYNLKYMAEISFAKTLILPFLFFISVCACNSVPKNESTPSQVRKIAIYELYFSDTAQFNAFHSLFRDTFNLPEEWVPFDIFNDGVVYDAAFFLGNTTLELLALYEGDSSLQGKAKFNRILFQASDIDSTDQYLRDAGLPHSPVFDFNIVSDSSPRMIGKQINLDSLSQRSNVNISFWEPLPAICNFHERGIAADSPEDLEKKLSAALQSNPAGIIGLKEMHLFLGPTEVSEWEKLWGKSNQNRWILDEGPEISYTLSSEKKGVDWIKIQVRDLAKAKNFLTRTSLIAKETNQVAIDQTHTSGLSIFFEE